jgi:predicted ArsR family transcriptional regulator
MFATRFPLPASLFPSTCMSLPRWISRSIGDTRAKILDEIHRAPVGVSALAAKFELAPNTVRTHLALLSRDGLIERAPRSKRPSARGKPAYEYRVSTLASGYLSSAYAPVVATLVEALRTRLTSGDIIGVLHSAGRRLAAPFRSMEAERSRRIADAAHALDALGAAAVLVNEPTRYRLTSECCPLAAIAGDHAGGCDVLAAFVSEIVGAPARRRCGHGANGPRCAFEIARAQAAPDASGHTGE